MMDLIARRLAEGTPPPTIKAEIREQYPNLPPQTLHRWWTVVVKRARPALHVIEDAMRQVQEAMQRAEAVATARTMRSAPLPVGEIMHEAVAAMRRVLAYAQGDDPNKPPRNPRLALAAATAITRSLETAMDLQQALLSAERVDRFHAAIIAEIGVESPQLQQRVLERLRMLTTAIEV